MDEQEILDRLKPICLCQGIRKSVFLKHIAAGITTVAGLKKASGAGNGSCGGERCTVRIAQMLEERRTG
jgi:bacterioferritin-associated ferredoxin